MLQIILTLAIFLILVIPMGKYMQWPAPCPLSDY